MMQGILIQARDGVAPEDLRDIVDDIVSGVAARFPSGIMRLGFGIGWDGRAPMHGWPPSLQACEYEGLGLRYGYRGSRYEKCRDHSLYILTHDAS